MKAVYAKRALLQERIAAAPPASAETETVVALPPAAAKSASPPPPEGFRVYEKSRAAPGILAMMEQIITDTKLMEKEAMKDEADAQLAYEGFVKETNASITEKDRSIVSKGEDQAKAEQELTETTSSLEGVTTELE